MLFFVIILLSKKKKTIKINLKKAFSGVSYLCSTQSKYYLDKTWHYFKNIFRITMSYKQLFFSLLNVSSSFMRLFSTGVALKKQVKSFKFFKKSIFCINPLVMTIRFSFVEFFSHLHTVECLNYSKKQYLFLKKLLVSLKTKLRFLIFKKTWTYTTKPVKRIKRRVVKLLKNV